MIEFQNVSKTFTIGKRHVHAVQDVTLKVEKGDIFGIIGFSGAGKSTLLRLVNLLEKPTKGAITINNTDITSLSSRQLRLQRRRIGMIFQNFNLFTSRTVEGNVAYPLKLEGTSKAEIDRRTAELLEFVGLSDKAKNYPEQLSGGQKQRVGIARALATNPEILICDEATSALDPETTEDILKLLKRVNQEFGITVLLITHEMNVISTICNRVAIMENGRVIEHGEVFNVFTNPAHPTTKRFIQSVNKDLPSQDLLKEWHAAGDQHIYQVTFTGSATSQPLLSKITQEHHVHFNVVYGAVREIQGQLLGNLVVSFKGDPLHITQAIHDLQQVVDIKEVVIHES